MPEVGDQFEDENGQLWTITDYVQYWEIEIDEEPETDEPYTTETNQWPVQSIKDKIGDELTPVEDDTEGNAGDEDPPYVCEECGEEFGSKQARGSHYGKKHDDEDDESTGEE